MSYQPLTYYIDNPQIHELIKFAGDRFQKWTHEDLWDLITIISAELSAAHPKDGHDVGLVRMVETRQALNLSWNAVAEHGLEILDGISRRDAKLLLMGLTAIAATSDIH
jgi:hypothetical protein